MPTVSEPQSFKPHFVLPLAVALLAAAGVSSRERRAVNETPLPTGKVITPAGTQTGVGSFPANALLSPDGRYLVVSNTGYRQYLTVLSVEDGRVVSQAPFNGIRTDGSKKKEGLYYGLAFGPASGGSVPLYVSRGAEDRVSVLTLSSDGKLADTGRSLADPSGIPTFKFPHHVAGLAVSADGSRLYAVNNNTGPETQMAGSLSILDTASGRLLAKAPVGGFPYAAAALTRGRGAGRKVYVSSERDGLVSVVDPAAGRRVTDVPTGDNPIALLLNRSQDRLYVANAGSDTVSVIDTRSDRVRDTLLVRPDDLRGLPGATPTGLALSPDERRLYVTLADMNAVAVVDLRRRKLLGCVPVGWYPTTVNVVSGGKRLLVTNAKGVSARSPNAVPAGPGGKWGRYIQDLLEGTVSQVEVPDGRELRESTERVLANNRLTPDQKQASTEGFRNPGIEHVIYIIKENRTYDQVLGDLPQGNGDPKLCLFPREVTPNLHALAERFVLLDNFYCCAEVSADGWNWSTSGMANEYTVRNAPYGYSGRGRVYDYEGLNNGVAVDLKGLPDAARSPGGYIWDLAAAKKIPFRNYGFFVDVELDEQGVPAEGGPTRGFNKPTKKALEGHTDESYRRFDMSYPDSDATLLLNARAPTQRKSFGRFNARSRFEEWKREFDEYVRNGSLPRFEMVRIPRDHTAGTSPGQHSPRAMVADNDYGVAQVVEAVSKSPYWKNTVIFVIEDDAQNGFDHVDAHRSICFVISPFVRKSTVDHRFYNTDSVLRTMELILGLPPMNQYDAVARPLRVFGDRPDNDAPYAAVLPEKRTVGEINGRTAYRAADNARLNYRDPDSVPDDVLNDILWGALRPGTPKPALRYSLRVARDDD